MNNFPNQDLIVNSIINGAIKSAENYLVWTNNRLLLSHGPDKILSIHVAQEIAKIEDAPEIFIDATISDILKCSLSNSKEYISYMKQKNIAQDTVSITLDEKFEHLNDEDSISKVIISIKNGIKSQKKVYLEEIETMCKMIDCDTTSLDYGVFCFYMDVSLSARKKLSKRVPEIVEKFEEVTKKFPSIKSTFIDSGIKVEKEIGEWIVGCFIIQT